MLSEVLTPWVGWAGEMGGWYQESCVEQRLHALAPDTLSHQVWPSWPTPLRGSSNGGDGPGTAPS